jgi:hypothetical protein
MLEPINPRVPRSNLAVKTDASQLLVWIFPVRQKQTRCSIWQPCPPLEVPLIDLQYMRVTSFPFAGHGVVKVCTMAEISGNSGHAAMILGLSHSSPHPVLGGQLGTGKYRSRFDLFLIISPMCSYLQLNWWCMDENLDNWINHVLRSMMQIGTCPCAHVRWATANLKYGKIDPDLIYF